MASKEEVAFVGVRIWGFRSRPSVCLGWSGISQMFRAEEVDCARAWRQERAVLAIDKDCRKTCVVGRESRGQRDRQQRDLKRSAKVWLHHEGTGGTLSSFQAVSSGEFNPAPTGPDLWPLPLVSRRWCLSSWNVLPDRSILVFLGALGQAGQQQCDVGWGLWARGPECLQTHRLPTRWYQEGGAVPDSTGWGRWTLCTWGFSWTPFLSFFPWMVFFFFFLPRDLWDHSFSTKDCSESAKSWPLNCQGIAWLVFVFEVYLIYSVVLASGVH